MVSECIRVVLADPSELFRDALAFRFQSYPRIAVVGSTVDSDQLVPLCQQERPHVVVMDVNLPGRGTFDAADAILQDAPQTKMVLLIRIAEISCAWGCKFWRRRI